MIAQELEVSLHMAFVEARQSRHEQSGFGAGLAVAAQRPYPNGLNLGRQALDAEFDLPRIQHFDPANYRQRPHG